jgi:hypothetical protein
LDDPHHRPDVIEDVGVGIVHVFPLGYGKKPTVTFQGFLNRLYRARPPRRDRNRNPGIDHSVPEGEYREGISLAHEFFLQKAFVIRPWSHSAH